VIGSVYTRREIAPLDLGVFAKLREGASLLIAANVPLDPDYKALRRERGRHHPDERLELGFCLLDLAVDFLGQRRASLTQLVEALDRLDGKFRFL